MISIALALVLTASPERFLGKPAEVAELCAALADDSIASPEPADPVGRAVALRSAQARRHEALETVFRIAVPARSVRFGDYDLGEQSLEIDPGPLWVFGGTVALDIQSAAPTLAVAPDRARAIAALQRSGRGSLWMRFLVDDEGCARGVSGGTVLPVTPLSLAFVGPDGKALAGSSGELAGPDEAVQPAQSLPEVKISNPLVISGRADVGAVSKAVLAAPSLQRCYQTALGRDPELGGMLVLQAVIGRGGRPDRVSVAMDGLGQAELVDCIGHGLRDLTLSGVGAGTRLYLPLEFTRL